MVDRVAAYQDLEDLISDIQVEAEEARWKMAKLIYEQRQETSIAATAEMFGKGRHHITYMYNCWDRRQLKHEKQTFNMFYNSQSVRGADPRKSVRGRRTQVKILKKLPMIG
jgi:hypothetical protein